MTLYEKLALFISAFSAVATFCAIVVALYNAKLPYRKRLKIINRESTKDASAYKFYRTGVDDSDIVIVNRSNGTYKIQGIDFIYRNSRLKVNEIYTESGIQSLPYKMKPYEAIGIESIGLALSPLFVAELYVKSINSANHAQSQKTDFNDFICNILDQCKPKFKINTPYEKNVGFFGSLSINKYRSAYLQAPDTVVNAYEIIKHKQTMQNGDNKFIVFWTKVAGVFSYKSKYLAGEVVKAMDKFGKKEARFIPGNRSILHLQKENGTVKEECWNIPEQSDYDAIFSMMQKTSDPTEK